MSPAGEIAGQRAGARWSPSSVSISRPREPTEGAPRPCASTGGRWLGSEVGPNRPAEAFCRTDPRELDAPWPCVEWVDSE
jgi:hypothetical protein